MAVKTQRRGRTAVTNKRCPGSDEPPLRDGRCTHCGKQLPLNGGGKEHDEVSSCVHWDKIESPHGAVSIGRCKKCGRKKEYKTPFQFSNFEAPIEPSTLSPYFHSRASHD